MLYTDKASVYTGRKRGLTDEEYRIFSRALKDLLITSKVGASLSIVYGEGNLTGAFNYLKDSCLEVAELLWSATKEDWDEKSKKILILFKERIDPLRKNFERTLIEETRTHRIIKNLSKKFSDLISGRNRFSKRLNKDSKGRADARH